MARNDGIDRTVARNQDLPTPDDVAKIQEHNEREKDSYSNQDIVPERTPLNVHFKTPTDDYVKMFEQMEQDGVISTRGLKPDAIKYGELVFDVNSAYFYNHGGYEFAKQFYADAYKAAVEIVGGEQYILSAVMHADEHNRAMSEALGEDVYHYHLHVVYIPVVEKQILWSKRCKDEALRGTVKETITQVSRSKKWDSKPVLDEDGNPKLNEKGKKILRSSYSVLQDDFFNFMRAAGYTDVERGERGSTEEHLTVTQFKVQAEQQRLEAVTGQVAQAEQSLEDAKAATEKQIPQFIYEHGSLPRGDDPLIRNEDWGTSYAFNPILSYMASAVLMKGMSLFTTNEWMLLLSARFVNVLLGALMAWVVLKAAKLLFPRRYAWMFTALVVFLPGNVILYSYVNCDALAMCSTAIIFYSWVKAYKEGWNWTTCAVSAIGMGLCFLSYYNAYGFILTTFFFFVGTMLTDQEKAPKERWKEMIQKGLFILVIVCVIALWWFIRNAILYHGDFLGRETSSACAELYARAKYKPSNSKTFQKKGDSMLCMIFYRPVYLEHDWLVTVLYSFVGAFGYNKIYLSKMIIVPYLCCLGIGLILMRNCCQRDFFFWNADGTQTAIAGKTKRKWSKTGWFTWANVFALLIPNYLNAYYSYSSDFQPQGRYSMPMLIPLMYFVTKGVQAFLKREKKLQKYEKLFCILVCVAAAALAAFTWARIIYPMYLQNYYGLR